MNMPSRTLSFSAAFLVLGAIPGLAQTGPAPVDVILEWNAVALEANVFDHNGPGAPGDQLSVTQGPPQSARALAMVHAAMFDAYNSVDPRYSPYKLRLDVMKGASADAAVAQAARDVLVYLFPAHTNHFNKALTRTLARVPNNTRKLQGIVVGKLVALNIVMVRLFDGAANIGTYTPTGKPGNHDVDPLNPKQGFVGPNFGSVRPFAVSNIRTFRASPPPRLGSPDYTFAFWEVAMLGGDGRETPTLRTYDQTVIGYYWSYNGSPSMGTPPRLYNQIARVIAQQEGNAVHENARLFALLNLAMADAGISAWDTKYVYDFWRPVRAIRLAGSDGNPDTDADPDWSPLGASRSNPYPGERNFTPAFPAYTSGHATFGAAVFKTLANFYQTDDIAFSFVSDEWNNVTKDQWGEVRPLIVRSFDSLSQASAENAASRIFNGVHWRFDGTEGVRTGNRIADAVYNSWLRPSGKSPRSIPDANFEAQIDAYLTATE